MLTEYRGVWALVVAVAWLSVWTGSVIAQPAPLHQITITHHLDSGAVQADALPHRAGVGVLQPQVVFTEVVHLPERPWMRLQFEQTQLAGSIDDGTASFIRLTSLHDGATQVLNEITIEQWRNSSAYFNGDAVLVEVLAFPAERPDDNRVIISRVLTGDEFSEPVELSICDGTDERELSNDPRDARSLPGGCTSWLFDDRHYCLLSAGHCAASTEVVEFNVPLQSAGGGWIFSHPDDQYPVDPASMQTLNQPCGSDWTQFGAFPNSNTGLTMIQAQGGSYTLASAAPSQQGQSIRIRGYGTTSSPVPPSWNRAQKEHTGPYFGVVGTTLHYRADTTGGNSGSAVIDLSTGLAIGIHTCGGCHSNGGTNVGTAINHAALQIALQNPQGVCTWPNPSPICHGDFNGDSMVDVSDLLLLLAAWGPCVDCPEDLEGTGEVGVADLLLLLEAWGECE